MKNESGLKPLGHAVLTVPWEDPVKKKESLIVLPDEVRARLEAIETQVMVIEVGPNAWADEPPRAKPGDVVLVGKYSGAVAKGPRDGKDYRLVNDNDIYCAVEVKANE